MVKSKIDQLRNKIDFIDESIAKLLLERIDCAKKIGLLKDKLKVKVYGFNRENQIINRLKSNYKLIPSDGIDIIFRQIISLCRNSEKKSTIYLLGDFKDFDYKQYFGDFSNYIKTTDLSLWLKELSNNKYSIGVSEYNINEKDIDEIEFELDGCIENNEKIKTIRVYTHKQDYL